MKKTLLIIICLLTAISSFAQKQRFDPEKFEAELERYIVIEAGLTPVEAARFFPVYREMRQRQLAIFFEDKNFVHVDETNPVACTQAIRSHDDNDLKMKKLQKEYHERFLKILTPQKVLRVIRAEDKFHREAFRKACKPNKHRQ